MHFSQSSVARRFPRPERAPQTRPCPLAGRPPVRVPPSVPSAFRLSILPIVPRRARYLKMPTRKTAGRRGASCRSSPCPFGRLVPSASFRPGTPFLVSSLLPDAFSIALSVPAPTLLSPGRCHDGLDMARSVAVHDRAPMSRLAQSRGLLPHHGTNSLARPRASHDRAVHRDRLAPSPSPSSRSLFRLSRLYILLSVLLRYQALVTKPSIELIRHSSARKHAARQSQPGQSSVLINIMIPNTS